jgi:hypothetical protein
LNQCNNSALGLDGKKFIMFKFLPEEAMRYLLGMFDKIMSTGMIPESWLRTKVVPILKPIKNPSSQYGFRKGRGTRDCLALLTTDVQSTDYRPLLNENSRRWHAFIVISGAYDNVLIDILCDIEKEVTLQVMIFLFRSLWRKVSVFFAGGREYMTLVGYKGLSQGSVLSPFLYNIIGLCADKFIPSGCEFRQYADDLVVYMAHRLFNLARELVQTACTSLNVFFSSMGLTISASKSEVMLFTRKHEHPPILVRIGSYVLP